MAEADQRFDVKGSVGIGIPWMPETEDGTLYAANVPAASGKPLRADLSARLDRDVRLDNDANCFALSGFGMMSSRSIRWSWGLSSGRA